MGRYRQFFCRATLCIRRSMPSCVVCLSVRLFATFIEAITVSTFSNFFHHLIAPPLQFYRTEGWLYSDEDPLNGSVETILMTASTARWVWKKSRFSTNRSIYLGNIQEMAIVMWNVDRNSYAMYRIVPFPMTLSDLEWLSEKLNDKQHRAAALP